MARKKTVKQPDSQRPPAEMLYADELEALKKWDKYPKPRGWELSPVAVKTFILGSGNGETDGTVISKKIYGDLLLRESDFVKQTQGLVRLRLAFRISRKFTFCNG